MRAPRLPYLRLRWLCSRVAHLVVFSTTAATSIPRILPKHVLHRAHPFIVLVIISYAPDPVNQCHIDIPALGSRLVNLLFALTVPLLLQAPPHPRPTVFLRRQLDATNHDPLIPQPDAQPNPIPLLRQPFQELLRQTPLELIRHPARNRHPQRAETD